MGIKGNEKIELMLDSQLKVEWNRGIRASPSRKKLEQKGRINKNWTQLEPGLGEEKKANGGPSMAGM